VKNLIRILGACVLLVSLSVAANPALADSRHGRKVYKWVDEQGLTHYGDHIPPEYAAQEQHVINGQGIEVERLEAQKTPSNGPGGSTEKGRGAAREPRQESAQHLRLGAGNRTSARSAAELLSDQIKVTGQFLEISTAS
jgi:hypothetical protein